MGKLVGYSELVDKFNRLTSKYKDQDEIALVINNEAGSKIERSTVSRMLNGKSGLNNLAFSVYVLEQIEKDCDPEYQYKML